MCYFRQHKERIRVSQGSRDKVEFPQLLNLLLLVPDSSEYLPIKTIHSVRYETNSLKGFNTEGEHVNYSRSRW